mmetsp:Transcript_28098/g.110474  ORF Transcript_28098/g.110474 Transcript_28098/m.110474 type:complete len:121 (+) Transcript_28098:1144-1506(+)
MTELNANCKVRYILRHHFTPCSEKVALDGFHVSVYLKRVDYVVVDDKNFTNQLFPYNDGLPPQNIRQRSPTRDGHSTLNDISAEGLQCLSLKVSWNVELPWPSVRTPLSGRGLVTLGTDC